MILHKKIDKVFLGIVVLLVVVGALLFVSAAFSVLADSKSQFLAILLRQFLFALVGGALVLFLFTRIPYKVWHKYGLIVALITLIMTVLVFVPGLGITHGGAQRWINLGGFSWQPAEALKLGVVMFFAGWLAKHHKHLGKVTRGLLPLLITLGVSGGVLLMQPDTGTFLVLAGTIVLMYFLAGGPWRDFFILLVLGIGMGVLLATTRPYVLDRLQTFVSPDHDPAGSSYQIIQSKIAIGSGGLLGRGFGQSIQKYDYLPEPTGDSIFAVVAEEWGFVGSVVFLGIFFAFLIRGLRIAHRVREPFGRYMVLGVVFLIVLQSLLNIASVIGVFPLTGLPLIFVSQGGTALLFALAGVGIVLHISRWQRAVRPARHKASLRARA